MRVNVSKIKQLLEDHGYQSMAEFIRVSGIPAGRFYSSMRKGSFSMLYVHVIARTLGISILEIMVDD